MATRRQLQQVQAFHVDGVDTGDVTERQAQALVLGEHHDRALALDAAPVAQFTLAGACALRLVDLLDVWPGVGLTEEGDGLFGGGELLHLVADHQRHLARLLDHVALGHDQAGHAGGRHRRAHGVPLHVDADLAVPAAPLLGGREPAAAAAHVAERSLAGAVGTATAHTRDTGHGAAGAPGLGRGLVSGQAAHAVRLAGVLGHVLVDEVDHVGPDRRAEHGRQGDRLPGLLILLIVDGDQGAG